MILQIGLVAPLIGLEEVSKNQLIQALKNKHPLKITTMNQNIQGRNLIGNK